MTARSFLAIFPFLLLLPRFAKAQPAFSADSAAAYLHVIASEIGPRTMGSPAEKRALRYAADKLREFGCDSVIVMPFSVTLKVNTSSGVAMGIRHGSSGRIILLGAHLDSVEPEVPGANDDGSGTAVILETARILCRTPHASTLVFCLFGGEEQNLQGSRFFVENFFGRDSIMLMLQADMADGSGVLNLDPDAFGISAPRWLVSAVFEESRRLGTAGLVYPTHFFALNYAFAGNGAGSDHEPFLEAGIPAVDFTSDVNSPIHTPRDNEENFDKSGLARTGNLLLSLVERFDGGTPQRRPETPDQYWLWVAGGRPIVLSFTSVWTLALISLILAIIALIRLRRHRIPRSDPAYRRWTGFKMLALTSVPVALAWLAPDCAGFVTGVRHPWLASIGAFYLLAAAGFVSGGWIVLKIVPLLRLSHDPMVFALRALLILILATAALGILTPRMMVEPVAALGLTALAFLVPDSRIKLILMLLSPVWMVRLIFSEWSPLLFRAVATIDTTSAGSWMTMNLLVIAGLTFWIYPFTMALAGTVRQSASLRRFVGMITPLKAGAGLAGIFLIGEAVCCLIPAYSGRWYRGIGINEEYELGGGKPGITIQSAEYLNGIRVRTAGEDTLLRGRIVSARLASGPGFDTGWVRVRRSDSVTANQGERRHSALITLSMKYRPYRVVVTYPAASRELREFQTPWKFRTGKDGEKIIEWYSFPDSIIAIPVSFISAGSDSIAETIEVTFDRLAQPVECGGSMIYTIPRTKFISSHQY